MGGRHEGFLADTHIGLLIQKKRLELVYARHGIDQRYEA